MAVWTDRIPINCWECPCDNYDYSCNLNDELIARDGRRYDCKLKKITYCKDCGYFAETEVMFRESDGETHIAKTDPRCTKTFPVHKIEDKEHHFCSDGKPRE